MKFFTPRELPTKPSTNSCYLLEDGWDDYGYKTSFGLHFADAKGNYIQIGQVKITFVDQTEKERTRLPEVFTSLTPNFCSLGASQSYYEELMELSESIRTSILIGLNDFVFNDHIRGIFANEDAFNTSLLRSMNAESMLNGYATILNGNVIQTGFNFSFKPRAASGQTVKLRVDPDSLPPTNVHVLIGRNGVGKTRILSGIADALTANSNPNDFSLDGELEPTSSTGFLFSGAQSNLGFANLVTVAFSAFDAFRPIGQENIKGDVRYDYVGLRTVGEPEQFKGDSELLIDFQQSLSACLSGLKLGRWCQAVDYLNSDPAFYEYDFPNLARGTDALDNIVSCFALLSSGHKIVLLTITKLVQLVEAHTLVLIDEPENHLHPPLLSSFIRAISYLMTTRNGVALIATHSPVVLQEVPSSCVTIMERARGEFLFHMPEIETFAENVGSLTKEVFKLEVTHSGYHALLAAHMELMDYDSLLQEFDNQIGREGKTIAKSLEFINSTKS